MGKMGKDGNLRRIVYRYGMEKDLPSGRGGVLINLGGAFCYLGRW